MGLENLHYLAIDPGEGRTGWAAFDESGDDIEFSAIHGGADAFMDWLEALEPAPSEIIFEDYSINPAVSHAWSKGGTIQLIGMVKRYARKNSIPVHSQPSTILKVALLHVGLYTVYYKSDGSKKKHVDDQISAYAHGVYYLQKHRIRKPRVAKK